MKGRRASLAIIGLTIFADMFGIGLAFPILPKLIEQFTGDAAESSYHYGLLAAVYALAQLVCAPLLGLLSDRHGCRPVLLASPLGLGIHPQGAQAAGRIGDSPLPYIPRSCASGVHADPPARS